MSAFFDPDRIHGRPVSVWSGERFVLEAYRQGGRTTHETAALESLCRRSVWVPDIGPLLSALRDFVTVLGRCARCPLHVCEAGSPRIARDEALVLALIAALQHGDERSAGVCLRSLTCASRCEPVAIAAATLALVLRSYGQTLVPVTEGAIRRALEGGAAEARTRH